MAIDVPEQHFYLTVAEEDENEVLELVRVDHEKYFIREDAAWVEVDPDADERVWGAIVDVSPEAVDAFDQAVDNGEVSTDIFEQYRVDEGDGE